MARLIDADAYLEKVCTYKETGCGSCKFSIVCPQDQPKIDAVPVRHGKWIYGNDFHWYTASCSKCGYQRRTDIKAKGWNEWRFCPNCGADMRGERDEID